MAPGYRNRTYILCCGEQPQGESVGRTERIKLVIAMKTIRLSLSFSHCMGSTICNKQLLVSKLAMTFTLDISADMEYCVITCHSTFSFLCSIL
jgi:hypothetical protein